jgi:L-rhamnose mutarotase
MQVNPEKPEQFLAYHEQVWSEMPRALESTGWVNYSIFEDTCGLLVGCFVTEAGVDPTAGMSTIALKDRWQRETDKFFDVSDTTKTEGLTLLTETFNLEPQLGGLAADNTER